MLKTDHSSSRTLSHTSHSKKPSQRTLRKSKKSRKLISFKNNSESSSVGRTSTFTPSTTTPTTLIASEDFTISLPTVQYGEIRWAVESNCASPILVSNRFRSRNKFENMDYSPDALKILHLPNAGGNSLESEVLSFEVLHRCFGAKLLKTEMEIEYCPESSKKTDYSVTLHGHHIGVSVTRAMKFNGVFTAQDARWLLEKKLQGIIVSSENVLDGWEKQILHVWTTHDYIADIIKTEFDKISDSLRKDTVVVLTICDYHSRHANVFSSNPLAIGPIFHVPPVVVK